MKNKFAKNSVLIELHIPDFEKAKKFYGKLGFRVVWEREPEGFKGYLIIKMGENILCFWAGNKQVLEHPYFKQFSKDSKRGYAVEIIIMVGDVEDYHKKVKSFANIVEPLQMRPWGLKDFRIEDPFGFYLRITEPHDVLDSKYAVP